MLHIVRVDYNNSSLRVVIRWQTLLAESDVTEYLVHIGRHMAVCLQSLSLCLGALRHRSPLSRLVREVVAIIRAHLVHLLKPQSISRLPIILFHFLELKVITLLQKILLGIFERSGSGRLNRGELGRLATVVAGLASRKIHNIWLLLHPIVVFGIAAARHVFATSHYCIDSCCSCINSQQTKYIFGYLL